MPPSLKKRAILSGFLGATASSVAKLALAPDSPVPTAVRSACVARVRPWLEGVRDGSGGWDWADATCPALSLAARGACLLCMVGINVWMVGSFLDGMDESGSVVGTALATASNFSSSALYGMILFDESVPALWWFGATLIATGTWLLSSVTLELNDSSGD